MPFQFPQLLYRGNYELTMGVNYEGSFLRAEFGGGLSETEKIFPGLMYGTLNYSALVKGAYVTTESGETFDRLTYFWNFYRERMDAGRAPFIMRAAAPLPEKLYLWEFSEVNLELTLIDRRLATTGIGVVQVYVRGVETLEDGSIGDEVLNPDFI